MGKALRILRSFKEFLEFLCIQGKFKVIPGGISGDPRGRAYYVHEATGVAQWHPPPQQRVYV